jgi:hypothetical protein
VNSNSQNERSQCMEQSPFKVSVQIMVPSPFILGVQFGSFSGTPVRNSVLAVFSFNFFFSQWNFQLVTGVVLAVSPGSMSSHRSKQLVSPLILPTRGRNFLSLWWFYWNFFFGLVGLSWWFSVNFESYFCGFVLRALARLSPFYFRHFIW